jgi:hypothetical protein
VHVSTASQSAFLNATVVSVAAALQHLLLTSSKRAATCLSACCAAAVPAAGGVWHVCSRSAGAAAAAAQPGTAAGARHARLGEGLRLGVGAWNALICLVACSV